MAAANESFRSRLITPFKSGNDRDFSHLMVPAWSKKLENPGSTATVSVKLSEMMEGRRYGLHLYSIDTKTSAKDALMSMDLELDVKGNVEGLKDGTMTLYRRRGNVVYMFDYFVDNQDPLRVNLGNVSRAALDGDDHPPMLIDKDEQREIIQREGVPLNGDWLDTAIAYLTAKAPGDEEIVNAEFAANTSLLGERTPSLA